jgi:hypothetical protein
MNQSQRSMHEPMVENGPSSFVIRYDVTNPLCHYLQMHLLRHNRIKIDRAFTNASENLGILYDGKDLTNNTSIYF